MNCQVGVVIRSPLIKQKSRICLSTIDKYYSSTLLYCFLYILVVFIKVRWWMYISIGFLFFILIYKIIYYSPSQPLTVFTIFLCSANVKFVNSALKHFPIDIPIPKFVNTKHYPPSNFYNYNNYCAQDGK